MSNTSINIKPFLPAQPGSDPADWRWAVTSTSWFELRSAGRSWFWRGSNGSPQVQISYWVLDRKLAVITWPSVSAPLLLIIHPSTRITQTTTGWIPSWVWVLVLVGVGLFIITVWVSVRIYGSSYLWSKHQFRAAAWRTTGCSQTCTVAETRVCRTGELLVLSGWDPLPTGSRWFSFIFTAPSVTLLELSFFILVK